MITTKEFAENTNTPYSTVARWAQQGIIPGVEREETLRGPVYLIPQSALNSFREWSPKLGRPFSPKKKAGRKKP